LGKTEPRKNLISIKTDKKIIESKDLRKRLARIMISGRILLEKAKDKNAHEGKEKVIICEKQMVIK